MFLKEIHKAINVAERTAQIMRHRVAERLELLVGSFEFCSVAMQILVKFPDRLFRMLALGDILCRTDDS